MNAAVICELQNLTGQLLQAYAANQLSDRLPVLLCEGKVRIRLPGFRGFAASAADAAAEQAALERRRTEAGELDYPIPHTPAFELAENTARANWDIYRFRVTSEVSRQLMDRLQIRFVRTADGWHIEALDWHTIYSHVPQTLPTLAEESLPQMPSAQIGPVDPATWYAARNLMSYVTINARSGLDDWLSEDCAFDLADFGSAQGKGETLALLRRIHQREVRGGGDYLCVPLTAAPWIRTFEDGAVGRWLVLSFELGKQREGFVRPIVRRLGVACAAFVREVGRLQLRRLELRFAAELPTLEYDHAQVMPHLMQVPDQKWYYHTHSQNTQHADAIAEVENTFFRWVGSMRCGGLHRYPMEYINDEKAEMHGTLVSPIWRSEDKMDAAGYLHWAESMDATWKPNEFSWHGILTPEILPNEDGTQVEAHWMDHSITGANRTDGPAMVFVATYSHEFTRVEDRWYHSGFGWEPLLGVPDYRYDPVETEGALADGGTYDYGMPLDFKVI